MGIDFAEFGGGFFLLLGLIFVAPLRKSICDKLWESLV
jgi:hypothetical protein